MDEKTRKTIDIPNKELRKLNILALENGMNVKRYIEEIISEALKSKENFKIVKVK